MAPNRTPVPMLRHWDGHFFLLLHFSFAILFLAIPSACTGALRFSTLESADYYLPPISVPQTPLVVYLPSPTPSPAITAEFRPPTPTPICSNELRFLEDVTIPDNTQIAPGTLIDKRWKVENAGQCNWDDRYSLRLVDGQDIEAPLEQALYPARSGTQAIIRILLIAPIEPGAYHSAWQAYDPTGNPFGDIIYVSFVIPNP